MKLNSLFTSIMVLLCCQLLAAVPTAINYQGRLANAGGAPVPDGSYSVVFTIYDAASGGTSKWTETQSVTTSGGLFAVLLGTITPVNDTVFNGTDRYLGVKVGSEPELSPRGRFVTVPYADRVSTVDGSTGGAIGGNIDLDSSTATTGNIYKDGMLFLHNGGGFANTCLGIHAGNLSMIGTRNTAMGLDCMRDNGSGEQNTAYGAGALTFNVSGHSNTAIGFGTQYQNTGHQNTAVGAYSLYSNVSGNYNTATGYGALNLNTVDGNTAYGHNALGNNTTGLNNVACGMYALFSNTTGARNTACGYQALLSTTSNDNTAVGYHALRNNNSGFNNTAYGSYALINNTSGQSNTACGSSALRNNTLGQINTAYGAHALANNTTGDLNTAIGPSTLQTNTTGNDNTAIGNNANVTVGNLSNATAIGNQAVVNASNKIRLGNSNVSVIEGQVAYTFSSDRNQKENLQPVGGDEVLRKIRGMSLTSWNYKNNDPKQFRHYGPVAQEFFEAFGHDGFGQSGDSTSINSGDMAGIMMIAIQTLEKEKELMKTKNTEMKAENAKLKVRLERVEATLLKLEGMVSSSDSRLGLK